MKDEGVDGGGRGEECAGWRFYVYLRARQCIIIEFATRNDVYVYRLCIDCIKMLQLNLNVIINKANPKRRRLMGQIQPSTVRTAI